MASDATILDNVPVTPAHKFAWRAFRGFVYGSPDSSPEHTKPAARPERENKIHSSPSRQSPRKKRVSMAPPPTAKTSLLSPQKRKRDPLPLPPMLSPTKSILRTPGAAPTPREKSLRDVNVKFKSVSPEARSGSGSIPVPLPRSMTVSGAVSVEKVDDLEKQVDELWEELEQSLVEGGSPPLLEVEKRKAKQERRETPQIGVTKPMPELSLKQSGQVDHEEYARRTEKEVKRLLRQHKKLRDYAQRADEQNMELHAMVEELRTENARLKAKLEKTDMKINTRREVESEGVFTNSRQDDDKKVTACQNQDRNSDARRKTEEVSKPKSDSFERSLRGSLASFSIHEDNTQSYEREESIESIKATTTITTAQARSPPKKRSSTIPNPPSSYPKTNKEPLFASNVPSYLPSQSLRGMNNNSLTSADSEAPTSFHPSTQPPTTTTTHRRANTHNAHSPLSLTALAAQLEPTPRPPAAATTTSTSTSTTTAPTNNGPLRSTTLPTITMPAGLNMAPDRVAAARARLQAKRNGSAVLTSGSGSACYSGGGAAESDAAGDSGVRFARGGVIGDSVDLETGADCNEGAGARPSGDSLFGPGQCRHHTMTMVLEEAMAKEFGFGGSGGGGGGSGRGSGRSRVRISRTSVTIGGGKSTAVVGQQQQGAANAQTLDEESALDWAKI